MSAQKSSSVPEKQSSRRQASLAWSDTAEGKDGSWKENRRLSFHAAQRTTLFRRILWRSLLLMVFTVSLTTLLSALVARSLIETGVLLHTESVSDAQSIVLWGSNEFIKTLLVLDLFLLLLAGIFARILARELTAPIKRLTAAMQRLRPKHWGFHRTVRTGDEVETLDRVAADLSQRLSLTYDHLEEEVAHRTQELKERYLLDRAILEEIEYGVFVADAKGSMTAVNPCGTRLLGQQEKDVVGKRAEEVLHFVSGNDILTKERHPLLASLRSHKSFRSRKEQRLSLLRKDGSFLPVNLSLSPLLQGNRIVGIVAIVQDCEEENRVDLMKSEFITLASHQLRTPLSSLRWYLELMRSEKDQKTQKSCLAQMESDARRMAGLLDDLLHVAHLEGGEIKVEKRAFDAVKFLRQLVKEWQLLAEQKHLSCILSVPQSTVTLVSDPTLVSLVLQNLFMNAVKYSPEGSEIHIGLRRERTHLSLSVADSGMGIAPEEQKNVFQKFFRAKNARKADAEGSGLGLYLAKTITEHLGGRITFTSRSAKGTTFIIRLPLR
jgi:PAS domain S-box-containing protein